MEQKTEIDITEFISLIDNNSIIDANFIAQHSQYLYEIMAKIAPNPDLLKNLTHLKLKHPEHLNEIIKIIASSPVLLIYFIDSPDKLELALMLSKSPDMIIENFVKLVFENDKAFNILEEISIKLADKDYDGKQILIRNTVYAALKNRPAPIEEFLTKIFSSSGLYRLFIRELSGLENIIEYWPNHEKIKDNFLRLALEGHFIKNVRDLEDVIEKFPEYAEKIKSLFKKSIESALLEKKLHDFRSLVWRYESLAKATVLYPELKDKILKKALSDSYLFDIYFDSNTIEEAIKIFPAYAGIIKIKFIEFALENPHIFIILMRDHGQDFKAVEKIIVLFPDQKDKLLSTAISNSTLFTFYFCSREILEEVINKFPEYAVILDLNDKINAAKKNMDHEAISNIHGSIKEALINRAITHKTLQLCFNFVATLLKETDSEETASGTKIYDELKNLHTYLESVKFPSLAHLCANSLKQSGIIAKESEHSLQIHLVSDIKNLETELEKLYDKEKMNIMNHHKIILIKILNQPNEWYVMGMNHKGRLTVEGPIPNDSEIGEILLNTKIPVSQEQKSLLLKQASKYFKTNLEELKLDLSPKVQNMFEDEKPENINYDLSKSNSM